MVIVNVKIHLSNSTSKFPSQLTIFLLQPPNHLRGEEFAQTGSSFVTL